MAELARAALLTLHLLTAASACGAPVAAALLALRRSIRTEQPHVIARLVTWGIGSLLLAAVCGVVSIGLIVAIGDESYLSTARRIPAYDYTMLASEWLFTFALLGVMAWLARGGVRRPRWFALLGLVAVTNLAYHFPTMMLVIGTEANAPTLAVGTLLDRAAFRERIIAPVMLARTWHFWALAVTVGGVVLAAATPNERRTEQGRTLTLAAARGVLAGLLLQAITGVAILTLLPAGPQRAMTGDALLATAALTGVLLIMALLTLRLLPTALGLSNQLHAGRLAAAITAATLLMTIVASS